MRLEEISGKYSAILFDTCAILSSAEKKTKSKKEKTILVTENLAYFLGLMEHPKNIFFTQAICEELEKRSPFEEKYPKKDEDLLTDNEREMFYQAKFSLLKRIYEKNRRINVEELFREEFQRNFSRYSEEKRRYGLSPADYRFATSLLTYSEKTSIAGITNDTNLIKFVLFATKDLRIPLERCNLFSRERINEYRPIKGKGTNGRYKI